MSLEQTRTVSTRNATEQSPSSSSAEVSEQGCSSAEMQPEDCVPEEQVEGAGGKSLLTEVLETLPETQSGLMSRALMVLEHVLLNDLDPAIRNAALEQYSSLITNECNLSLMQSRQGAPAYGEQSPDMEFGQAGAPQRRYGQRY